MKMNSLAEVILLQVEAAIVLIVNSLQEVEVEMVILEEVMMMNLMVAKNPLQLVQVGIQNPVKEKSHYQTFCSKVMKNFPAKGD